MFTYFTDRDGKYQLKSLAESGFDPLARTCQFMLTEEAHHMFVGETGIARIVKRCLEVMKERGTEDPAAIRAAGAIDLPTVQRYLNFWFSSSLDLFGSEVSSNAATYFAAGIKGRPDEASYEDHVALNATYDVAVPAGASGAAVEHVAMRNAMNEVTRAAYVRDCDIGVKRWNRLIAKAGFAFELKLPSTRFRRSIGAWAGHTVDLAGEPIPAAEWERRRDEFLPSESDRAFVRSLMQKVVEPGKMASWIAPPERGINNLPVEYEYVHLQ
jgi:benzoyl-CoA 2,3-dioxygenase component B